MSDIEDGEILSDEGDETLKTIGDTNPIDVYNVATRPERSQPLERSGHRGLTSKEIYYSDDDTENSSSSSDDESPVANKQPRRGSSSHSNDQKPGHKKDSQWLAMAHQRVLTQKGKKVNNVWGSVIQEESMSKFVNQLNRNDAISYEERGAESYDYTKAKTDPRFNEELSEDSSEESSEENQGPADLTEKETFGFVVDKPKKKGIKTRLGHKVKDETDESDCSMEETEHLELEKQNVKSRHRHRAGGRKVNGDNCSKTRNIKSRLGKGKGEKNSDDENSMDVDAKAGKSNKNDSGQNSAGKNRAQKRTFQSRNRRKSALDDVEVKEMKRIEVKEGVDDMELVDIILDALREPQEQTELFLKLLDEIGRDKMVKIFKATEDIEDMGGLMIQNGSRRRTPGGVFLFLVRKDTEISKQQLNAIFADQNSVYIAKRKEERKERKKLTRRLKREEQLRKVKTVAMETGDVKENVVTDCIVNSEKPYEGKIVEKEDEEGALDNEEGELDNEELVDIQLLE